MSLSAHPSAAAAAPLYPQILRLFTAIIGNAPTADFFYSNDLKASVRVDVVVVVVVVVVVFVVVVVVVVLLLSFSSSSPPSPSSLSSPSPVVAIVRGRARVSGMDLSRHVRACVRYSSVL